MKLFGCLHNLAFIIYSKHKWNKTNLLHFSVTHKLWSSKLNLRLCFCFAAINHNYGDNQQNLKHRKKNGSKSTNQNQQMWPKAFASWEVWKHTSLSIQLLPITRALQSKKCRRKVDFWWISEMFANIHKDTTFRPDFLLRRARVIGNSCNHQWLIKSHCLLRSSRKVGSFYPKI